MGLTEVVELHRPSLRQRATVWMRPSRWSDTTRMVLLFLLAVLPYLNTLRNGFVYDDESQVLHNPYIRDFGHLREIFTTEVLSYQGIGSAPNYYRPLMNFGYLLCFRLFGPKAYGFHLVNLLLHGLVVVLLFAVTKRMFRNSTVAFVAAGLFALHPIHTESVDWIAAVTDLELTFFYLLTFRLYLGLDRAKPSRYGLTQFSDGGQFRANGNFQRTGSDASPAGHPLRARLPRRPRRDDDSAEVRALRRPVASDRSLPSSSRSLPGNSRSRPVVVGWGRSRVLCHYPVWAVHVEAALAGPPLCLLRLYGQRRPYGPPYPCRVLSPCF